jgi:hypothetical protein
MRGKRTEPKWREFERVVAMIEEAAAPRGATVRSPDLIRDLTTGEMREVDASIRFSVGTVEILITVECQKRSRKAADTWIEQLATKRTKIGASKTIAVSEKGFSRSAHFTARHHNIELRTLSEVAPEHIEDWFITGPIVNCIPETSNLAFFVKLEDRSEYIELPDPWEPRLYHQYVRSPFPAVNLWAFHEMSNPGRFSRLPRDGSVTRITYDVDATRPDLIPVPVSKSKDTPSFLMIELDGSRMVVTDIKMSADVCIHSVPFDLADGVHRSYKGGDDIVAQTSRFKGEVFGLPAKFDLVSHGDEVTGVVEFPSGARLGLGRTTYIPASHLQRDACAYCEKACEMTPRPILPDFLVPRGVKAWEVFLCEHCAHRFEVWDAYAAEVWRHVPLDLTDIPHGSFGLSNIDGAVIRLWLLSLLWRMGVSRALTTVELGEHEGLIRELLGGTTPDQKERYPALCVALSFEGRRVEFFYPPVWGRSGANRVLSIILKGVLFNFLVGTDTANATEVVRKVRWDFPVLDWREVDFLVDAALKATAVTPKPAT